jgi:two-component system chemotaxis sensor kinase CheA
MPGIEDKRLLHAFLEEAEELLEKLNQALLKLERDHTREEVIHEVFRIVHSIKSEAALLGLTGLSELAHRLEDALDEIRNQRVPLTKALMDVIFTATDAIQEIVKRISLGEDDTDFDLSAIIAELDARLPRRSGKPGPRDTARPVVTEVRFDTLELVQLREARDRGEILYRLSVEIEEDAPMKYSRAYLVFNQLEQLVNVIKSQPSMTEPIEEDSFYAQVQFYFSSEADSREIISTCEIDQISSRELSELDYGDFLQADVPEPEGVLERETPDSAAAGSWQEKSFIRVETRKLNEIWQSLGDLVICKARVRQLFESLGTTRGHIRDHLESVTDSLEKITREMQQAMVETRMVPVAVLFNKFPRLVRDLSRKLGKNVALLIRGKETEIDRSIIEVLSDPLTHIIRNALDHGIETPADRLKQGKEEQGQLILSAQQQGGRIVLDISDDGRGLDIEKIRAKADLEQSVSDEEVIKLIFSPGFSTKEQVSDLSGRGVGLDVVATRIRNELKGEVLVTSVPGRGTRITILLPLTLTIVHSLIIRCREFYFAIPMGDMDETVSIAPDEQGKDEIILDGMKLPLFRLETLLGLTAPARTNGGGGEAVERGGVILNQQNRRCCLLVDELVEDEDVVIKPIDALLNTRGLFSGAAVRGDGGILFILHSARILEAGRGAES